MSYVDEVRDRLRIELPHLEEPLLNLYTLLAFTERPCVTLESVHNAWVIWKSAYDPGHPSVKPFEELSPGVQELDRKYADAINRAYEASREKQ